MIWKLSVIIHPFMPFKKQLENSVRSSLNPIPVKANMPFKSKNLTLMLASKVVALWRENISSKHICWLLIKMAPSRFMKNLEEDYLALASVVGRTSSTFREVPPRRTLILSQIKFVTKWRFLWWIWPFFEKKIPERVKRPTEQRIYFKNTIYQSVNFELDNDLP